MNYTIREMKTTEYPLLEEFLYQAIFVPEGYEAPSREILKSTELQLYIEHFKDKKDDQCFIAEIKDKIVGAVWVSIMDDYGHIDNDTPSLAISLYKEYRGRGLGTVLMKEMIQWLTNKRYKRVSLSVQKQNKALHLYKNLGFTIVDEHEEEYIMILSL